MLLFVPTGQEENTNDTKKYYEDDNCNAFFEPVVNFTNYLYVLHEQDPTATVLLPRSWKMEEIVFSARKQAGLLEDGTATTFNTGSPSRSGYFASAGRAG